MNLYVLAWSYGGSVDSQSDGPIVLGFLGWKVRTLCVCG